MDLLTLYRNASSTRAHPDGEQNFVGANRPDLFLAIVHKIKETLELLFGDKSMEAVNRAGLFQVEGEPVSVSMAQAPDLTGNFRNWFNGRANGGNRLLAVTQRIRSKGFIPSSLP